MPENADQNPEPVKLFSRQSLPDAKAHTIFWPIVVVGVAADLWSKLAVFNWLIGEPYQEYSVIDGLFKMVMRVNDGAAFSIASGQRMWLVSISLIAMIIVLGIFFFGHVKHRLMQVALGLFTAGIIGNLYDRAFNEGFVRDFLDFYVGDHHWPAFNVADSMLCTSVGLILISNLFGKHN